MRLRWLSILVACLACALGAARAEIIPYGDVLYVYPGETAAEPNLTLRLRGERMNPDTWRWNRTRRWPARCSACMPKTPRASMCRGPMRPTPPNR